MTSPFSPKLVLATHNTGKLQEISNLLKSFQVEVVSSGVLGVVEPEETEDTFEGNALLKATATSETTGLPCLADDSGLVVHGLEGRPGVYSANWAELPTGGRDFSLAMKRVAEELGDNPDRSASFICVLALVWPDGRAETFEGRVDGHLTFPPRGMGGFGYDPIFIPDGHQQTFGEMDSAQKNKISHRARALEKFVNHYFNG